jgi:putative membrane protein
MVAQLLALFSAFEHVGFAFLEMVLWRRPAGRRIFGNSEEKAETTAVLALNQGLYNLFLAAGLVFAVWRGDAGLQTFFLACVVVAGAVGAFTAKRSIWWVQGMPALIALVLLHL